MWPSGIGAHALGTEQVVSSISGSVGYIIPHSMFIELVVTWVPSGCSEYMWLDTKIMFLKHFALYAFICFRVYLDQNSATFTVSVKQTMSFMSKPPNAA